MPEQEPEKQAKKKRVVLMGPPRVENGVDGADVPLGGAETEVLALLLIGTLLLPPQGVWNAFGDSGGEAGFEVRRDWLVEMFRPEDYAQARRRQAARDHVGYLLDRLHPRGASDPPVPFHVFPAGEKRERGWVRLTWRHLDSDIVELRDAAKNPHAPACQKEVLRLAARPLLDGADYAWLQRTDFRQAAARLDAAYLAALCGRADSLLVLMENSRADGRADEVYGYRTQVLPLLDRAAERLHGDPALSAFSPRLEDLRARAAYPTPPQAVPAPFVSRLPRPITRFVGREDERQRIGALLTTERLVTLIGLGGCGKTRLALEAAAEIEENGRCDVRLVELASLSDPSLLPQTVAAALALEIQGDFVEALITHFRGQETPTLLLLDNCEHLIDACAALAETLLQACLALTVLATSRKPLNIDGEHLCRLHPLPFPDPNAPPGEGRDGEGRDPVAVLLGYDAPRLFVDRALQFRPFTLGPEHVRSVAVICAALDGIPLALELAAARVKRWPLDQLAEKLTDRFRLLTDGRRTAPPHHKTLRAVMDWSYDLLTESEKALFCRLSVFAGGWTQDAAEAVAAEAVGVSEALDSLVSHSLVTVETDDSGGRFGMLETVRQYAEDRLRERREWNAARDKHRDFFLALAEAADTPLEGSEQRERLARLEVQVDNLRAALAWCFDPAGGRLREAAGKGLRLAGALRLFWDNHGRFLEGKQWLETAIAQGWEGASPHVQAKALGALGSLVSHLGDHAAAAAHLHQSLALQRQLGDSGGAAISLNALGLMALDQGDPAAAEALFQESLRLRLAINDTRGRVGLLGNLGLAAAGQGRIEEARELYRQSLALERQFGDSSALTLNNLAILSFRQGDYPDARALFEESLALSRAAGYAHAVAATLNNLGFVMQNLGDDSAAAAYLEESLALSRQIGEKETLADALNNLADLASHQGDHDAAWGLYEESLALRRQLGNRQNIAYSLHNLGEVADAQGRLAEAAALFQESLTLLRGLGDQYGLAFSLEGHASIAAASGCPTRAAHLWAAADALREATSNPLPPTAQDAYRVKVAALRASLGDAAFESAWAEGRAMSWEQAVAFALGEGAEAT